MFCNWTILLSPLPLSPQPSCLHTVTINLPSGFTQPFFCNSIRILKCIYVFSRVWNAFLKKFFLYFGLQTVLYLHSDSIDHGYLNKTGIVTVTKFNMNMVRKAHNLMLVKQQFGLPITLLPIFHKLIMTENKKFWNLKTTWFWNPKLEMRILQNFLSTY